MKGKKSVHTAQTDPLICVGLGIAGLGVILLAQALGSLVDDGLAGGVVFFFGDLAGFVHVVEVFEEPASGWVGGVVVGEE